MAFVGLVQGVSGDLNVAAYDYGYFDDIVLAVEDTGTTVRTYEGNDTIDFSRIANSFSLSATFCGSGNDTFIGGSGRELVHDGSGDDVISLGGGADVIHPGAGNDVYNGGDGVDTIFLTFVNDDGFGSALNTRGVVLDLAIKTVQDLGIFGMDKVLNFEDVVCGSGNNRISGNGKANEILGNSGNDVLDGRDGDDRLLGYDGNDVIIGGKGADDLYASVLIDGARDLIRYLDVSDSNATDGIDEIFFFEDGGSNTDDRIDLKAIDANAVLAGDQKFQFIGASAFGTSARGQIRYETDGTDTFVYVDTDADTDAEMTIIVRGLTSLGAGDFIL